MKPLLLAALLFAAALLTAPPPAVAEPDESKKDSGPLTTQATAAPQARPATRALTVASWGGAYAQSQQRALISPFEKETGVSVTLVDHGGAFDRWLGDKDGKPPEWDVVDLSVAAVERGCRNGQLEKIDAKDLAAADGGTPARDDFLAGGLHDCGVSSVAWSSLIVFDRGAFEKRQPSSAKNFFDSERFPGKRALPKGPKYVLELALMADGVAPGDVYRQLELEAGAVRAFAMLDKIRDDIVWWEKAQEPLALLAADKAELAIAFNGRIFQSIVRDALPFGVVWDGQIYDLDMWAIPKGTPNRKTAMRFIAYATRPDSLAAQARWFPYGPMRKSALAKIGKHAEVDVEMGPFVPTLAANFKNALRRDAAWWSKHEQRLTQRFQDWLNAASEFADDEEMPDLDKKKK